MAKKKVVWFSRHPWSFEELEAMKKWAGGEVDVVSLKEEAQKTLTAASDVSTAYKRISDAVKNEGCFAVFGVFPAPLRELLLDDAMTPSPSTPCFEAWNAATSKFKKWCMTGKILQQP